MAQKRSMQNLPRAGRWAIYVALAVVFAIACAFLSNWQFSRNQERSADLALIETNYDAVPVPVASVLRGTTEFVPDTEWLPVLLRGRYLPDEQLLARNRPHGGTSAFEVLTPFQLDDGRIFIVNRGWVPPASDSSDPAVVPAPPSGDVSVTVRLRPSEPTPVSGRGAPEGQVPVIDLPAIAQQTGSETITAAYGLMISEDPAPAERPTPLPSPAEDPGPYLSYAIQWILFAIMGFVFIGYVIKTEIAQRREDRADAAHRDAEPDASAPPLPRATRAPTRRRDADSDAEDAILDSAAR